MPNSNPSLSVKDAILSAAQRGQPFCAADILKACPGVSKGTVNVALSNLALKGSISRLRQGTYVTANARAVKCSRPSGAVRRVKRYETRRRDPILDLLNEPRTVEETARLLHLSERRVTQRLQQLVTDGLIERESGETPTYKRMIGDLSKLDGVASRLGGIDQTRATLLKRLPEHGVVTQVDLTKNIYLSCQSADRHVAGLEHAKLVEVFKLGMARYVLLTDAGRNHFLRQSGDTRLAPADLRSSYSAMRTDMLTLLEMFGPLPERELIAAMRKFSPDLPDNASLRETCRLMRETGLLKTVKRSGADHVTLGPTSAEVLAYLHRFGPPLSEERRRLACKLLAEDAA